MCRLIVPLCLLIITLSGCGRIDAPTAVQALPAATIATSEVVTMQAIIQKETVVSNTPSMTPEAEQPSPSPTTTATLTASATPAVPTASSPLPAPSATAVALRPATTQPTLQAALPLPSATPNTQVDPPRDPQLDALVQGARADLAQRLGVVIDAVEIVEVRSVTWPNPGLGCEQPGIAYKQVPVDGLLIRLRVGGQIFNYHSGGRKPPFLCQQPQKPISSGGSGGEDQ